MTISDRDLPLAWFLGPKAENGQLFEELLLEVVRDYLHWRRNYFPADPILVSRSVQRDLVHQSDALVQHLHGLLADLRRNFPFYSPRYFGYQLSDTLMPAMLGYFAGMLFNPNNVTPGAAPVTTEMEILACNTLLQMLGFRPPPPPPPPHEDAEAYYRREAEQTYGWAHLTSGGTVANIEALWIARQVRYTPPAIKAVAQMRGLKIPVRLPGGGEADINELEDRALLLLQVPEAIDLVSRYIRALREDPDLAGLDGEQLGRAAWHYLRQSPLSTDRGVGPLFLKHPPVILVAGTRHYSIAKAADIIGVGAGNVIHVRTDSQFRMDVGDLRHRLAGLVRSGRIPLAVIASTGTTEEGSVDPVHQILEVRRELEARQGASFWLHVDAAWCGYLRALFSLEPRDRAALIAERVGAAGGQPFAGDLEAWHAELCRGPASHHNGAGPVASATPGRLQELLSRGDLRRYIAELSTLLEVRHGAGPEVNAALERDASPREITGWVSRFVSDTMTDPVTGGDVPLQWPTAEVGAAFGAFGEADSITVDPHKLGYAPYPSGCVAFRDDRVRLFVQQRAPYVSVGHPDPLIHVPPRHAPPHEPPGEGRAVMVDSFSPFILEGSKPGAAASALWLSLQAVPPTPRGHGLILRESLLAARRLYEWLRRWEDLEQPRGPRSRFVPLTGEAPDTNIVTFVVLTSSTRTLTDLNALGQRIYEQFSIQTELGQRDAAYAQPFFLSHTHMEAGEYPADTLHGFFACCGLKDVEPEYNRVGLFVFRATVMSPYIEASRRHCGQDFPRLLVEQLARTVHHMPEQNGRPRTHPSAIESS